MPQDAAGTRQRSTSGRGSLAASAERSRGGVVFDKEVGRAAPHHNDGSLSSATAKQAVVAATLANAELAATKATSDLYYDRYLATDSENARLRVGLEQQEVDALLVIRRLEAQLMAAFEDANAFKQSVEERLARQAQAEQEVVAHYEALLKERDRSIADFAALVARLQDDLRQASRFVQQRQEHQQELQELHNSMEELVMANEKETAALRFQNVDRKMKLVALERTMREEFQAMVDRESRRLLEAKHAALLQHNGALEKDKEGLVKDLDELISLTAKINAERTSMKRAAELHKTAHEEVLRHTVARNRQSREGEIKIQRLEARVRELRAEVQATKRDLKAAYEGKVATLTQQLEAAQNANVVMQTELKSMRALAGKVVEQRSDLERFFYVALEDCKRYKSASLSSSTAAAATATRTPRTPVPGKHTGGGGGSSSSRAGPLSSSLPSRDTAAGAGDTFRLTQPTILEGTGRGTAAEVVPLPPVKPPVTIVPLPPTLTPTSPPPPPPPPSSVHIEKLSWEDKEKVIKALFFYINASYYKVPAAT